MSSIAIAESTIPGTKFIRYGGLILRYGLVVTVFWIGLSKFTPEEADGIMPLIANQPLMGWIYLFLGVQLVSNIIGVIEIVGAVLVALKPALPRLSAVGSVIMIVLFASTVSFLVTSPGVVDSSTNQIPVLTDLGGFLIKDLVLLGASVWTLGDAVQANARRRLRFEVDSATSPFLS